MEKQKRWQFYLILAVIVLTLINVLPTVFYYIKPLKDPIDQPRAEKIAQTLIKRVNGLENDAQEWLLSFSRNLGLKPVSIKLRENDPGVFEISFKNTHDARLFKKYLPRAGTLIPFVPAQLELYSGQEPSETTVLVSRQIPIHLDPAEASRSFHFFSKKEGENISLPYRNHVYDRATQLIHGLAGPSKQATQLATLAKNGSDSKYNDLAIALAREIAEYADTFGEEHPITQRYFGSFSQTNEANSDLLLQKALARFDTIKGELDREKLKLESSQKLLQKEGGLVENDQDIRLSTLNSQRAALDKASLLLKKYPSVFRGGKKPFTPNEVESRLQAGWAGVSTKEPFQFFDFEGRHPLLSGIVIDWGNDKISTQLYEDVQNIRLNQKHTEEAAIARDRLNAYTINEMARIARLTDEAIAPAGAEFAIQLTQLANANSFLAFDLGFVAQQQSQHLLSQLLADWKPEHADLQQGVYPILPYESLMTLSPQEQKLGLTVYSPATSDSEPPAGFRRTSLYIIARGLDAIIQKYRETPESPEAELLARDIEKLSALLKNKGFIAYSGSSFGMDPAFSQDLIFELDDYYSMLLNGTRENFYVKGSKKDALLDFTDVEQRIITTNRIEDAYQEELLKWRDDYRAAQVDIDPSRHFDVPPPAKNAYWENLKLSLRKYFRGDDRKVLRWGLDLSGGKTVRIGLRDHSNRPVTDPEDLKQAVNELYTRVNKMGVAERVIRVENENIILDFPGSQAFTASELVKASAMYFHIVNEKFSPANPNLAKEVNQFLQNVWNEAVVTNRKDAQSINEIAWEQLGGNLQTGQLSQPRTEIARILREQGLVLAPPRDQVKSSDFDDSLSSIAVMRGNEYAEWDGQTHPLMIVFHNYALEGSSLTNIQSGYDPSEGNILNFGVKRAYEAGHPRAGLSPRDDFYAWTSQFSEDKVAGTPKEAYSQGRGWRMAVILNDQLITKPHLRAALRDAATISGRFTQREISQLASDLKAGSLSFTPKILSEQNVSAELGEEERVKGISASLIGFFLVAGAMIGYYRFAGLVATCAVLFNLLIMWGVLQNLGAALTLPGIAGIVLTIGMAVDANVLVFERVREEFALSGRIATAIQAGYRKAFSAIIDSNVTTIIAALILIQFDSGPVKGFAVTLIIGLISSMFTALFMTRYYFAGWVQNPKNKSLSMAHWIKNTHIDFLGYTKPAVIISLIIMVAGALMFYNQRHTLFGMDFTGGYSLLTEVQEVPGEEKGFYRKAATEALLSQGAAPTDVEVRQLGRPNELRIQFSLGMEEPGHPFHNLPPIEKEETVYEYEKDPRLVWVVHALESKGLYIQKSELKNLDKQWSMMSGQFSETMRNNAFYALVLALISILIYITLRFEFKYAIGAVVGLVHDVIITLGIFAFFHKAGFPTQIDLEVVGAIMTIIGYSLNDTIIVFDRIREDIKILRKMKYPDIINHALNVTLSRTFMTGGTTLLVLISLVLFGSHSIFDFSLVMTIGVIVGTFSSLFIAAPVTLFFHNREEQHRNEETAYKKA